MQNTARETQPVSWSEITEVIKSNPHRNKGLTEIRAQPNMEAAVASAATVPWMTRGWTYKASDVRAHPMTLALLATDPLYEISAPNTRKGIEKDAAMELATDFDTVDGCDYLSDFGFTFIFSRFEKSPLNASGIGAA